MPTVLSILLWESLDIPHRLQPVGGPVSRLVKTCKAESYNKRMLGTLGVPRDSKKGMIGTLGTPRDSKKEC